MQLNYDSLKNTKVWEDAGFVLPRFDVAKVKEDTMRDPRWIHFGAGNIFRAFPAAVQQDLLNEGIEDRGVIAAEGYSYNVIDTVFDPYDNLTVAVTLKADGSIEKAVLASIVEALKLDSNHEEHFARLREIFRNPGLKVASFTITEKGYSLVGADGSLMPVVLQDFADGPAKPQSYIGKIASLCYERYQNGAMPMALLSMDNCSHNGTRLFEAIQAYAKAWTENGLVDPGFLVYVEDANYLSLGA